MSFVFPDMTLLDEHGNKTPAPNKERQTEALQLLLLLLPPVNRSLLKLLLDLLYHTAKRQDANKMSAFNLALMFAPHVLWPRHVRRRIQPIEKAAFRELLLCWRAALIEMQNILRCPACCDVTLCYCRLLMNVALPHFFSMNGKRDCWYIGC